MITAVDSNLLVNILTGTQAESRTALSAVMKAGSEGPLILPILCYGELAGRFEDETAFDRFLDTFPFTVRLMDKQDAFLAGAYFRQYRNRGGSRDRILADFVIAAQANRYADRLLTDDKRFSEAVFPGLAVVKTGHFG